MVRVLIVSGFLGAGKTSFIKELVDRTDKKIAILENEYGEIGIDGKLLGADEESAPNSLEVFELSQGCICCSTKADFSSSVLTIASTIEPDILVVEPTGIGRLSNIINNINHLSYERIKLLKPITIVSPENISKNLKEDVFCDQIKYSGSVIFSRLENKDEDFIKELSKEIRKINKEAYISSCPYKKLGDKWWNEVISQLNNGELIVEGGNEIDDFDELSIRNPSVYSLNELIFLLDALSFGVFGSVLRAKGYLKLGKEWIHFEFVDGIYEIRGIEDMKENVVVFIGKNIKTKFLKEVFNRNSNNLKIKFLRR